MRRWIGLCAVLALVPAGIAQTTALMPGRDTVQLCRRIVELMEAATVAVPGLARAGAPALEDTRQALANLAMSPRNSAMTYTFLTEARAFLTLSDAMPKPYPFPVEARRQASELRENMDRLESHFRALLDLKEVEVRGADRDNLKRYAEDNQKLPPPSPERSRVVFLGDSITDGWRLNEYFVGRDFVNRGISGQITGEMLGRMTEDVIRLKPRAVLVLAGTNDIARGVPLRTIEDNLGMIADLAEFHDIKPIFASVLPVSDYHRATDPSYARTTLRPPALILELNTWLQSFCRQRRFAYLDYYSALVDKAGFLQADAADDGLHPNAKGYRIMAPLALAAVDETVPAGRAAGKKKKKR